ncbi:MAG: beta-galactosidase [Phycisphaerae bacterium]
MTAVSYDHRAVTINGKRTLLLSGAIHYPRSSREMWPRLMDLSRKAGLNAIETYVFWNLHEQQRRVYDFSDRLDLKYFCRLAQERELHVILRIGPFICAETNYGGFPSWLRDEPGIQMRTNNEPFKREMAQWVRFLCDYLRPEFAPNGGPIILAQIENEYALIASQYGQEGQKYLTWAINLGLAQNLGVPWVMCLGGMPGAIETINDWFGHRLLEKHFMEHPDQPAVWSENWQAWYDTYGYPHHVRSAENTAYAAARFFAGGGTGNNYYMWHGGTNFGREAMFLQTTSYDSDAPLDEYGLVTTKYNHLSRLHHILWKFSDELLRRDPPQPKVFGPQQVAYDYEPLIFLCNDDCAPAKVEYRENKYLLAGQSVILLADGKVLMNTAEISTDSTVRRKMKPLKKTFSAFTQWRELKKNSAPVITVNVPVEQLTFTLDKTDYCRYSTNFAVSPHHAGAGELRLTGVADFVYVYVDEKLVAWTANPLVEERGPMSGPNFTQSFPLNLKAGTHELSLLCCGLGLIKGDWLIGGENMVNERKGLWGKVTWKDLPIGGPWQIQPGLAGERWRVFEEAGDLVPWKKKAGRSKPLSWWRTLFDRPKGLGPWTLDLQGMNKGLVWLNGRCLCRYWLAPAVGQTPERLKQQGIQDIGTGKPTQRYYHVPADWLNDHNTLVLFEEMGGDPLSIKLCRRV